MTQLCLLGMQITCVVLVLRHLDRHTLHNLQAIAFQPFDLTRIVGQKPDLADAQILQNLRANPVIPKICRETELKVGINSIQPLPPAAYTPAAC